jgi:tetratricopeptide (TPR) repeat protein
LGFVESIRELLRDEKSKEAEKIIIINQASSMDIDILLAIIYIINKKQKDRVNTILSKAKDSIDSLDIKSLTDLAYAYFLLGRYKESEDILVKLIDKDDFIVLQRLIFIYLSTNRVDKAIDILDKANKIESNSFRIIPLRLRVYLMQKNNDALAKLLDSISIDTLVTDIHLIDSYIGSMVYLDRVGEVLDVVDTILQKDIEQKIISKVSFHKSNILVSQNRYYEAEVTLKEAFVVDKSNDKIAISLADLYTLRGGYIEAINIYSHLVSIYPEDIIYYFPLINILIDKSYCSRAEDILLKAKELIDNNKEYTVNILYYEAKILQDNNPKEAINKYKDALLKYSKNIPLLQGLGYTYLLIGDTNKAIEAFRDIEKISPMAGFSALASAKQFPKDKESIKKIESFLNNKNISHNDSSIMFALASAMEANRDYKRAFEWATKANNIEKSLLSYSKDDNTKDIEDIISVFSKDFVNSFSQYGNRSKKPTFVLGMPRSGTTLVEQMLGNHPRVFAAGELGIVPTSIHSIDIWQNNIQSNKLYPKALYSFTEKVINKKAQKHLDEIEKLAIDSGEDITHIDRIIDKLPHNFENIGFIKLLFPNAKIIYCKRCYEAIALSSYFINFGAKHGGLGYSYDLEDLGSHIADHKAIMEHWKSIYGDEILEIEYERVVEEPKKYAKMMLDYLELDWDDNVLEHTSLKRSVKTASVWQVRQSVYQTSKEKWHNYKDELLPFSKSLQESIYRWENKSIEPYSVEVVDSIFYKAFEYHEMGDFVNAERGYRDILKHQPNHNRATYLLATIAYQYGHFKEALQMYNLVSKDYQYLPAYHYNLALTLVELNSFATAKVSLKRALNLNNEYKEAMELLRELEKRLD